MYGKRYGIAFTKRRIFLTSDERIPHGCPFSLATLILKALFPIVVPVAPSRTVK
jgi:hypothetical protein